MADNRIYLPTQPWIPIETNAVRGDAHQTVGAAGKKSVFAEVLKQETTAVKFSQHALERMRSRNLTLSNQDMAKLSEAVDKIAQKGAKESLVYLSEVALVVSIKNKTVITAMDGGSAKDTIFTNIDSAVIL